MSAKPQKVTDKFLSVLTTTASGFPARCVVAIKDRGANAFLERYSFSTIEDVDVSPDRSAFSFNAASLSRVVEVAGFEEVTEVKEMGSSRVDTPSVKKTREPA